MGGPRLVELGGGDHRRVFQRLTLGDKLVELAARDADALTDIERLVNWKLQELDKRDAARLDDYRAITKSRQ